MEVGVYGGTMVTFRMSFFCSDAVRLGNKWLLLDLGV